MKSTYLIMIFVLFVSFATRDLLFAQVSEDDFSVKQDNYRVIGVGDSLKDAEFDAYQNAIIEFFKKNLSSEDIKANSSKLLKEFFSVKKIKSYIKSSKVVSKEDGNKVKLVIDVLLDRKKIMESLSKIGVKTKDQKEIEETSNGES